ncbi:hypothetical protein FHG87_003824, partial [Trinorchestia longiramus]
MVLVTATATICFIVPQKKSLLIASSLHVDLSSTRNEVLGTKYLERSTWNEHLERSMAAQHRGNTIHRPVVLAVLLSLVLGCNGFPFPHQHVATKSNTIVLSNSASPQVPAGEWRTRGGSKMFRDMQQHPKTEVQGLLNHRLTRELDEYFLDEAVELDTDSDVSETTDSAATTTTPTTTTTTPTTTTTTPT